MSPVSPLHYFKFLQFLQVFTNIMSPNKTAQNCPTCKVLFAGQRLVPIMFQTHLFLQFVSPPYIILRNRAEDSLVISCDVPSKIDVGLSVPSLSGCFCPDFKPFPGAFGIILGLGLLSITLKTHIRAPVHRVIGLDG